MSIDIYLLFVGCICISSAYIYTMANQFKFIVMFLFSQKNDAYIVNFNLKSQLILNS